MGKEEDYRIKISNFNSEDMEQANSFVDEVLLTEPIEDSLVLGNPDNILKSSSICSLPTTPYLDNDDVHSISKNWFELSSEIDGFCFLDKNQQNQLSSSTPAVDNLIPREQPFSFSTSTKNNNLVIAMPENSTMYDDRRHETSSPCYYQSQWDPIPITIAIPKPGDVNYPHNHNFIPNNSFINSSPIDVNPISTYTNSVPEFRYYDDGIGAIFRNTNINMNRLESDCSNHSIVNNSASCSRQERVFTSMKKKNKVEPWTKSEHTRFLVGLKRCGKGDWKSISRNFVVTKSSTQVASHAQKFFQRQNSTHKRPSIHDINTVDKDFEDSLLVFLQNRTSQFQPNSFRPQMPLPSRPATPPPK